MDAQLSAYLNKEVPNVSAKSMQAVLELTAEGATVPFIARYRKDKTGNLDEIQIREVISAHETYQEVVKRKAFILKEIQDQGNLTSALRERIEKSWDLGDLEEIYRPFKKKKKTKATIAREAGLEPLADWLWKLAHKEIKEEKSIEVKAKDFLNVAAGFASYDLVLKGAQDILTERIVNEAELRQVVLKNYLERGKLNSERTKNFKPNSKYEMYAKHEEPVKGLLETKASHRYMAMRRGWQEEELTIKIVGDEEGLIRQYESFATTDPNSPAGELLKQCARNALTTYVIPSVTNDIHRKLKEKSDADAIRVFSENLRKLLLASPFGPKVVLGVDPGLKSGCKMALVDRSGAYLTHTVFQILGEGAHENLKKLFSEALSQIQVDAIAVGNGTAGRQTEVFLRKVLKEINREIPVIMVSESGASVYSASEIAREEFPNLDLTVRGAISIARRLQDPLSELVKVDPKSIGVGQYQHDVGASPLKKSLDAVVESCVNAVGVDVNTASAALLSYVAGIGPQTALAIVEHRKKSLFQDRSELLKVPRFSAKAFEQAAGFLRVPNGKVFLDSTGIHPERYAAVRDMAQDLGVSISDLSGSGAKKLVDLRTKWATIIGEFTFDDIIKELEKPGRDPRDPFKAFSFLEDIFEVKDLKVGMEAPGIVTNVTNFGAFVDIGVHQDGLVHISELAHEFVEDPRKVVSPGDHVRVKVLAVDLQKNQISLSMKLGPAPERPARAPRPEARAQQRSAQGGGGESRSQQRPQQQARPQAQQNRDHRGPRKDSPAPGKPQRAPAKPFNNPFASLQNLSVGKK